MAGNLKEVRDRIASVNNTQQITKAMKMVSASKLRLAQMAIQRMRPYADKLNEMLRNILSNMDGDSSTQYGVERPVEKVCLVVVTSNRGLCGAFNTNINKAVVNKLTEEYADQLAAGNVTLVFIGKKGYDFFRKRYNNIHFNTEYLGLFDDLSFDNVKKVSQWLMDSFLNGKFDKIEVAYGFFKNAAVQYSLVQQFLPVEKLEAAEGAEESKHKVEYVFEPDKEELLNDLVPGILQTQFQKFVLDTHASEHGARMTAMDKASENANDLLKELKLSYNKARQEAITKEILEIVGGAAALEQG